MQVLAPKYYKDFKCIADKCTHSCCVGWEIDIDKNTLEKYEGCVGGYFEKIKKSLDYTGTPHIKLGSDERCPHLDENKLCRIITECGESYLSDICREHPRFYNLASDSMLLGLGMACEEAARIILSSDSYSDFVKVSKIDFEPCHSDLNIAEELDGIYKILLDENILYKEKLDIIYAEYGVSPSKISDELWHNLINELEFLNEDSRIRFLAYSSDKTTPTEYEKILERALAYFIYRHASDKTDREEFIAAIGFATFMERLFASLLKAESPDLSEAFLIARLISEEIEYCEENTENIMLEFQLL